MSKDAHEGGEPKPQGDASAQRRPEPVSAAMRELVGGGAAYDDRRRKEGRVRPESPSGLIERFSPEPKRPSAVGLPSWRGDTAPGLGDPPPSEDPSEAETARPGDVAPPTAKLDTAQDDAPTSGRMSKEERDALAKEIALGVRGGKPAVPYMARRERAAAQPEEGSAKVVVKPESPKPPKAKPVEAEAVRHSREAATVARLRDDDAPPATLPEKRLERKIGAAALAVAMLLVGVLVGRYVMQPSPGPGNALSSSSPTSPTMAQLASSFPAALSAVSISPEGATAPTSSGLGAAASVDPVHAPTAPSTKAKPVPNPGQKPTAAPALSAEAPLLEPKPHPPTPTSPAPAPVSTELKPF